MRIPSLSVLKVFIRITSDKHGKRCYSSIPYCLLLKSLATLLCLDISNVDVFFF